MALWMIEGRRFVSCGESKRLGLSGQMGWLRLPIHWATLGQMTFGPLLEVDKPM